MIYHWCHASDWDRAGDIYTPPGFDEEGFVHCSFRRQVEATASSLLPGEQGLVLICIDDTELEVVVEDLYESGEGFPHVYQPIPVESVRAVVAFPPDEGGSFTFPEDAPEE